MNRWSFYLIFSLMLPPLLAAQDTTTQPAASSTALPAPTSGPPPSDPYIIEDGGYSLEPIFWLNRAQPLLRGGAAATATGTLEFPGQSKFAYGGEASLPAGPQNSLRFSYFRVQGNANETLSQDQTIFSEAYSAGDYLNSSYRLQSFKLSWDYLGYTWHHGGGKIRLKTLYELQYNTISASSYAPFKAVTSDSSGNTDYNTANGSRNLILPTFGLELEQAFARHYRWEAKASGFGIPGRAAIADMEGTLVARIRQVELMAGEKFYYLKTSPKSAAYFTGQLSGAYVGVRYYWGRE